MKKPDIQILQITSILFSLPHASNPETFVHFHLDFIILVSNTTTNAGAAESIRFEALFEEIKMSNPQDKTTCLAVGSMIERKYLNVLGFGNSACYRIVVERFEQIRNSARRKGEDVCNLRNY
jgi:hypothetical protein